MSAGRDAIFGGPLEDGMADTSAEGQETSAPSNGPVFPDSDPGTCPRSAPVPEPFSQSLAPRQQRDPVTKRFLPGHTVTLKTGEYSPRVVRALLPGQEAQLAKLDGRRAQLIADQGGEAECSQIRLDLVDSYNATVTFLEWSRQNILERGPFTSKGRTRAAVSLYLSMLDRQVKLAAMLGLDRRMHGVIDSPHEYLAKAQMGPTAAQALPREAIPPAPDAEHAGQARPQAEPPRGEG